MGKLRVFIWILLFSACLPTLSEATDYYVRTDGHDSCDGLADVADARPASCAWLTIQHALDTAVAGDTVTVKAGTYAETLVTSGSGTAVANRVFQGEKSGETFLTTIDPGTVVTGWAAAPGVGPNVYSVARSTIGFTPDEVTVDGKRIGVINSTYMGNGTGMAILGYAVDKTITYTDPCACTINYWDYMGGLFGTASDNVLTYIRLVDGTDPSTHTVKAYQSTYSLALLAGASYNTIKDFSVKSSATGIGIYAGGVGNIIDGNEVLGGETKIGVYDGSSSNIVRNNTISMNWLGFSDFGARSYGTDAVHYTRCHLYMILKYTVGTSSSHDHAIHLISAGDNNQIYGNTISQGMIGITVFSTGDSTDDTLVYDNTIEDMSSDAISISYGAVGTKYYNNSLDNCESGFRWNEINNATYTSRSAYIYNNAISLPANIGYAMFVNWLSSGGNDELQPVHLIYGNTINGGYESFYNARHDVGQLLGGFQFKNNILYSKYSFQDQEAMDTAGLIGAFDHNVIGIDDTTITSAPWYGAGNVQVNPYVVSATDLHLQGKSTVKNLGTPLASPYNTDKDSVPLPTPYGWPVGSYGYNSFGGSSGSFSGNIQ